MKQFFCINCYENWIIKYAVDGEDHVHMFNNGFPMGNRDNFLDFLRDHGYDDSCNGHYVLSYG